jgi:hypothetical protein
LSFAESTSERGSRANGRRARWRRNGAIFAAYTVYFALLSLPWLAAATTSVPIADRYGRDDARLVTWILWWVTRSIRHDPLNVFDPPINYPAPNQLAGSEHFATTQLVALPVDLLTGNPVLALNVVLFLVFPLSAWAMYRLARRLDFTPQVAWLAGLMLSLGPLQVPARVYSLQTAPMYLAAAALTLHRLRESTALRSLVAYATVLLAGFFTAFYTVALLLVTVPIWGVAELLRPLDRRRRFAALATIGLLGALAVLAVAARPYLSRVGEAPVLSTSRPLSTVLAMCFRGEAAGIVVLVAAAVGCWGIVDRARRSIVVLGLVLVVVSIVLMSPLPRTVVEALPPSAIRRLLTVPLDFFRITERYQAITSFGLVLLAATGLERMVRRVSDRAGVAILLASFALLTWERGGLLYGQMTDTSPSLTDDAPIYAAIARVTAAQPPGPLLVLPASSFGQSQQPESMMAMMAHGLPLVLGHTGYQPPHRKAVDAAVKRLPADSALQDLVDMTHLRWVLLLPPDDWGQGAQERFLQGLLRRPGVTYAWDRSGWILLAIQRAPRSEVPFDSIAHPAP